MLARPEVAMLGRIPRILLVDRDAEGLARTQEAFRQCGLHAHFVISHEPEEAKRFLAKQGEFVDVPSPDLVILDGGRALADGGLLAFIKRTPGLRQLPTIVLGDADRPEDVNACYDLYANTYLVKPAGWESFLGAIRTLEHYWFVAAALPA